MSLATRMLDTSALGHIMQVSSLSGYAVSLQAQSASTAAAATALIGAGGPAAAASASPAPSASPITSGSLLSAATASALFQATQASPGGLQTSTATASDTINSGAQTSAVSQTEQDTSNAMGPLGNLTTNDIAFMEASLGVKQVTIPNPSGLSNTLVQLQNSQGQDIDGSDTFSKFQQLGIDISIGRTNGSISGQLTASNFDQITTSMSGAGGGLTASEIAAGQEWLSNEVSQSS